MQDILRGAGTQIRTPANDYEQLRRNTDYNPLRMNAKIVLSCWGIYICTFFSRYLSFFDHSNISPFLINSLISPCFNAGIQYLFSGKDSSSYLCCGCRACVFQLPASLYNQTNYCRVKDRNWVSPNKNVWSSLESTYSAIADFCVWSSRQCRLFDPKQVLILCFVVWIGGYCEWNVWWKKWTT